jgi:hypothetical protein
MPRRLHVVLGADIHGYLENYRDDRDLMNIVMGIFLHEMRGRSVVSEAGELMATFVSQNDDLARRDNHSITAFAVSRQASVSGGVVDQSDADQSIA